MNNENNELLLDNQICFALYLASKTLTQAYQAHLEPLDLTYPQYLAMLVLWELDGIAVKTLGERLHLDSGTLSPLLKKLEAKGLVTRARDEYDERALVVQLTPTGRALKKRAASVPACLARDVGLPRKDLIALLQALKQFNAALAPKS